MSISLVHADALTQFSASSISVSITIDSDVAAGDLIVIPYMTRSVVTTPSGYTKLAEVNVTNFTAQYSGLFVKTSNGTEGGTSVTVTQSSSSRIEAMHAIFRSTSGGLEVSQTDTFDGDASLNGTLPALTESEGFVGISVASNIYAAANDHPFDIVSGSDSEWARLNTGANVSADGNRLSGFYGIYTGADTTALTLTCTNGSRDWQASILSFIESAAAIVVETAVETDTANPVLAPLILGVANEADSANAISSSSVTTIVTEFDAGNVSPTLSSITNAGTATPTVEIEAITAGGEWRQLFWAHENVADKTVTWFINRATMTENTFDPATGWLPQWTLAPDVADPVWAQAASRTLNGGSTGTIEFEFSSLPSGLVYFATHPIKSNAYAAIFANELLTDYSSVASPTTSADSSGVYNTTPAENDENGNPVGENDQFAIKLAFGGSTTDGGPKRKLVMFAGIHAQGEHASWLAYESAMRWILDDASEAAQNIRANWDIYTYFNVTANGIVAGNRRQNPSRNIDPNRDFIDQDLQEIQALTAAVLADTGGSADALFSWHAFSRAYAEFIPGTRSTQNTQTAAFIANGNTIFSTSIVYDVDITTTDSAWGYDVLGCQVSFASEVPQRGDTSLAFYEGIGVKWMQALELTDSQGLFYNGVTLAATEEGADTFEATLEVTVEATLTATEEGEDTFAAVVNVEDGTISLTLAATESGEDTFAGLIEVEIEFSLAATESGEDTFEAVLFNDDGTRSVDLAATESGSDTFSASVTVVPIVPPGPPSTKKTYVYDLTTGQWARWSTDGTENLWDMVHGVLWKELGGNMGQPTFGTVAGSKTSNLVLKVDPNVQTDNTVDGEGTPITRVVTGGLPMRQRTFVRQSNLRLTASVGSPTSTPAAVTMRFSDDGGRTWTARQPITLTPSAWGQEIAWRGLGVIRSPNRLFEISDTGGLVRISDCDAMVEDDAD